MGIYGQTQKVGDYDIPLVYLIVGGGLALLWVSGQMNAIKMLVMMFIFFAMYRAYSKAREAGFSPQQALFGGGGTGGAPGTPSGGSDDFKSGGSVINRGGGKP